VLLRSGDSDRVYVHRRSATKLVMPGLHDCWAGGVVGPGEDPAGTAARELAEELGVTGVPLTPLFTLVYDEGPGGLRRADPAWPFVPDGRMLVQRWFAERDAEQRRRP
jgi:8-oxo-dGTP pyrophosphatase MutT (NUDIX family)